jgi:hypothetical protein
MLLTFDKDFGELAGRSPSARACGIVLARTPPRHPGTPDSFWPKRSPRAVIGPAISR